MGREEGVFAKKSKIRDGLADLEDLNKEEIIKKCYDLASCLEKANDNVSVCHELLEKMLIELEQLKATTPHINTTEYNKSWSWVNKIVYVLKKIKRPLLSSEIIEFIMPYEPVLRYSHNRPQAFSAHLHKAVKYKRVIAYKLGGSRGYYYILPDWMEVTGKVMKEYEDKIFFK
jgi:Zn-dependent M16 (insulinase) family peptidase